MQSKETKFDQKRLNNQKKLHLEPFQWPFTANMLKFKYIMQGYAQEIYRTQFFVGLRIQVEAPGVLAAL